MLWCFQIMMLFIYSKTRRLCTIITRVFSSTARPTNRAPCLTSPIRLESLCRLQFFFSHAERHNNIVDTILPRTRKQSGAGAARLARGLKGNSKLKSLAVRHVRLSDPRALGVLSSVLGGHPSLVTLSLGYCGLTGESGGRLASSVIRAHAGRRDGMVWSAGLRRPRGVVGNTAAAAPARIATAGCLSVDLSGNQLGDAGVHVVARSLQSDTWLVGRLA